MEHDKYELNAATMRDIVDKVPQDKWHLVLRDMGEMLNQTQAVLGAVGSVAKALGVDVPVSELVKMQDSITWVDDGKCKNEITFTDENDEQVGSIKFGDKA